MATLAISLKEYPFPDIKVNATVIFSILNSYTRRQQRTSRVIGTLLGEVQEDGSIKVTDCFAVPYTEKVDEFYVAISQEYHKTMYAFHKRNNKKEVIVGWYTTTTANGEFVIDNSSLIHDFYCNECEENDLPEPIHLVVDTTLMSDNMNVRAFWRRPIDVGEHQLASAFYEIGAKIDLTEAEATCLYHMINGQANEETKQDGSVSSSSAWSKSDIMSKIPATSDNLDTSVVHLEDVIKNIQEYVDNVCDGKIEPDREIGIAISNAVNSFTTVIPGPNSTLSQQQLQTKVQDLLMVSYLSTLAQTQTNISEKLNAIL